jgi:hypothetical protein
MENNMATPEDLLFLLNGKYSSLTVGFNDVHAPNYKTAQEYRDEYFAYGHPDEKNPLIEWASEEERMKALRENSVWTIQWYPKTPIGFHCVGASTFEAAAQFALSLK